MKTYRTKPYPNGKYLVQITIMNVGSEERARELAGHYTGEFEWIRKPFDIKTGIELANTHGLIETLIITERLL